MRRREEVEDCDKVGETTVVVEQGRTRHIWRLADNKGAFWEFDPLRSQVRRVLEGEQIAQWYDLEK